MNNNINIAELLKDCPKGTKLYSIIFGEVELKEVWDKGRTAFIVVTNSFGHEEKFYPDGKYNTHYSDSECTLFPSKEQRDWSKFCPFKDGDVIYSVVDTFKWVSIFKKDTENEIVTYTDYELNHNIFYGANNAGVLCKKYVIGGKRLATEKEKQKLFQAIKDNGYRWNEETKTLEKLVEQKFKVGDRVKKDKDYISGIVTNISDDGSYKVEYQDGGVSYVSIAYQDAWELVPNKFDIAAFVPFESRVLVRDCNLHEWEGEIFIRYTNKSFNNCNFTTPGGRRWKQCIPYEGNEHLLGTTNDCNEYYKTWKDETDE